ncbi:polyketide synthase dehydratase domain-containing protein, partial [Streptomyces diacarni]|uniref:polyketide synthase dehydratase domain-containing protein n=1 Tax=Streptomyces diacarni TaxID=2800381 RepID=UPI0033CF48E5
MSAHPVLTSAIEDVVDEHPERPEVIVTGSLQRDHGDLRQMLTSAARLWAHGTDITWPTPTPTAPTSSSTECVELPTYPFQRQSYWATHTTGTTDATTLGLTATAHPLLGALTELPDGGHLFTGSVSLDSQPWLADHAIAEMVLLPGTAFLELALHACTELGCAEIEELTVGTALVVPEQGTVQLQVTVEAPDENGCRAMSIRSQPLAADKQSHEPSVWTTHATGTLAVDSDEELDTDRAETAGRLEVWPPAQATACDVDQLYDRFADLGYEYGPLFRGLHSAWRTEQQTYGDAHLPGEAEGKQDKPFHVHPALFDAALHAGALRTLLPQEASGDTGHPAGDAVRLPFSWRGVRSLGTGTVTGASSLRARLTHLTDESFAVLLADETGAPLVTVDSLTTRRLSSDQLGKAAAAALQTAPYQLEWTPLTDEAASEGAPAASWGVLGADSDWSWASEELSVTHYADVTALRDEMSAEAPVPDTVMTVCGDTSLRAEEDGQGSVAHRAHTLAEQVLDVVRGWLGEERLSGSRLVLVTRGAVAAGVGEGVPDVAAATCWGLVRSAQSENPGRLVLVDAEPGEGPVSWGSVAAAVAGAVSAGEWQVALRGGRVLVPRLAKTSGDTAALPVDEGGLSGLGGGGTVLVTGGTGVLGAATARHLVSRYGVE